APGTRAGLGVIGVDEAAVGESGARHAYYHLVLDDQGRERDGGTVLGFLDLRIPEHAPGFAVECHQVGVERAHVEFVAQDGGAAVHHSAADAEDVGQSALVMPDRAAGPRVERPGVVVVAGDIHDAV